jgi:hypothetical protein
MRWLLALTVAVMLGAGAGASADDNAARPEIGKPVQQAQQLVREKKIAAALARLKQADAVPGKSRYETYIIAETRAAATLAGGDYAATVTALDQVLATGFLAPAEAAKRLLTLIEIEYRLKDYAKTVADAARYEKAGGTDREPRLLAAQSLYLQNDYAGAARAIRALLDADARAGRPADEQLVLTLASSDFKAHDQPGYIDALERLVVIHATPQYWAELIAAVQRRPGFADRLALDLDRLVAATGATATAVQYVEAAELALQEGFPGDARNFLAKGYAAGVLGKGAAAARQQRLTDMAKQQSETDEKTLAAQAAEADHAKDGTAAEKLGEAYVSYGRYDAAIATLERAIAKGGLKAPEDAKLHLGIAYLGAGQKDKAKSVLGALVGGNGVQDLARLWLIADGVR